MIGEQIAENETGANVGEVEELRDLVAEELEQAEAELGAQYEHPKKILQDDADSQRVPVYERRILGHDDTHEDESGQAGQRDEVVLVIQI